MIYMRSSKSFMKLIFFAIGLCISGNLFSQEFIVTAGGLRNRTDTSKKFVMIGIGNHSAKQLYDQTLRYIAVHYEDSGKAIRARWDTVDLMFDTYVYDFLVYNNTGARLGIEARYTTEMRFYPDSVRYEIIFLDMKGQASNYRLLFKGKWLKSYIVFKENGKLFKPQTKADIENHFNDELYRITQFLKQDPNGG